MKNILYFILIFTFKCLAQKQGQQKIDSLLAEIPKVKNDTIKARLYNGVANEYFYINLEKALEVSRKGLKHANSMKWGRAIAGFNLSIGRAFGVMGNYDSSKKYYNRALLLYQKQNDDENIFSLLNNFGVNEQNLKADNIKALDFYFKALKIAEKIKSSAKIALSYGNISKVFLSQDNTEKAINYGLKSVAIYKKLFENGETIFERELGIELTNLGIIYIKRNSPLSAKSTLEEAIIVNRKVGNNANLALCYSNLMLISYFSPEKRIEYGLKASKIFETINPNSIDAITNFANLGIEYFSQFKFPLSKLSTENMNQHLIKAEHYLKLAISKSEAIEDKKSTAYYYGNLAEIQAEKGEFKHAYLNFRAYQAAQDSLYSQKAKNEIAGLETKREVDIRDKEIQLKNMALGAQKKQRIGYLVGLVLLATIGSLLFYQSQTRKKTNHKLQKLNTELDEANKLKAKFFAILSHDLRSPVANLISFLNLQKESPELLSAEIKQRNELKISESAENLLENMESMLLWSKGQMENFEPKMKQVSINELFDYIKKFFNSDNSIQISFENPDNLILKTDEDYLRTIMQNLSSNSIKAINNIPNPKIKWTAKLENGKISLSIADNGPGISPQQLNTLFSGDLEIGTKTGFGFHLIRDLAKAIGCELAVKSQTGIGSEFLLKFVT